MGRDVLGWVVGGMVTDVGGGATWASSWQPFCLERVLRVESSGSARAPIIAACLDWEVRRSRLLFRARGFLRLTSITCTLSDRLVTSSYLQALYALHTYREANKEPSVDDRARTRCAADQRASSSSTLHKSAQDPTRSHPTSFIHLPHPPGEHQGPWSGGSGGPRAGRNQLLGYRMRKAVGEQQQWRRRWRGVDLSIQPL